MTRLYPGDLKRCILRDNLIRAIYIDHNLIGVNLHRSPCSRWWKPLFQSFILLNLMYNLFC